MHFMLYRYMMFEERDTKTRKNPSDMRTINPRLYETKDKPETCPVNLLLEYTHRYVLIIFSSKQFIT